MPNPFMPYSDARFPDTRWTLLLALKDEARRQNALEALCRAYWRPICSYLQRHHPAPEAEDMTQEFMLMLLRNELLERARREEGRLRSWLLRALELFVANHQRVARSMKRGGGVLPERLESTQVQAAMAAMTTQDGGDLSFDREWAEAVVRRSVESLREQYAAAGREAVFQAMAPWLLAEGDAGTQAVAAARCGLTITNFRVQLHRLRGRYRDELRRQIAITTASESEALEELRHLLAVLQAG
jgi:RNA polymerase sigma-70 factor (ECF subfamily)